MAKRGNRSSDTRTKKQAATGGAKSQANAQVAASDLGAMSIEQRIVWICLHVLVIAVPVAMSNWTWLGFQLPLTYDQFDILKVFLQRGITLIALAAWAWHMFVRGGRVRRTKIDYVILALLGWIVLTSVLSIHPPTAIFGKYRRFEGLISFINYALIFFLTTQMVDRASRIRSLARTLFFGGLLVSAYGVAQYMGMDPVKWGNLPFELNRAFSTYGNPDLLGGYLIFPLAIGLALALSEKDLIWRVVYWLGFLISVACWIVAFTRGAWIGGFVAIVLVGVVAFLHRVKLSAVDYSFMGAIGVVATTLVIVSLSATSAVMNVLVRLASILNFNSGSSKTRFEIWQAAIEAIKDRPIFGFGADTFRLVFPRYKPVQYVADAGYLSVADNVHNYPLQITSALGIPGFFLLYGTFAAAAWFSAPLIFRRHEGNDRLVLAGFWAAAAGYLTHLMFGLSVTGSSFLLWVAMAVVLSPLARTVEIKPPKWGVWAALIVVVLVVSLSVANVIYIRADYHYLRARVVDQGAARIEQVEQALALNPYNDMYRAELGLAHIDSMVALLNQAQSLPEEQAGPYIQSAQSEFLKAEEALQDTIEFVPWEYDNYVFLANLYNVAADTLDPAYRDKAVETARQGVEVEEFGPAIRFQLARALMELGEYDEARKHAQFASEMDPDYFEVVLLLGEIELKAGNLEGAKAAYETAQGMNPAYSGLADTLQSIEDSLAAQSR